MKKSRVWFVGVAAVLATSVTVGAGAFAEGSGETTFVAPTFAVYDATEKVYRIDMRVWVYEPEPDSTLRGLFVSGLKSTLDVEEGTPEAETFGQRMRMFLVDNERGEDVVVHHGGHETKLGETASNGHVTGTVTIPAKGKVAKQLQLRVVVDDGESTAERTVPVLSPNGLAVVSDIDDTIKDSQVLDRKKLLEKTFMKEFEAVPGMARAYRKLAKSGASFHYLSSSPWQLYGPLDEFRSRAGFPDGTYHLRQYRPKSISSNEDLVGDSQPHKVGNLESLLKRLPGRSFILIGDAGEKDPEVYGRIARENPGRVRAIYIRKVEGADLSDERFAKAFEGLKIPTHVFDDPSVISRKSKPPKAN